MTVATAEETRLGKSSHGSEMAERADSRPKQGSAEGGGDEGAEHSTDAGETQRSGAPLILPEPVGHQGSQAAAGIGHAAPPGRGFRPMASETNAVMTMPGACR